MAALQTPLWLVNSFIDPFPPTALWRRHAQTVDFAYWLSRIRKGLRLKKKKRKEKTINIGRLSVPSLVTYYLIYWVILSLCHSFTLLSVKIYISINTSLFITEFVGCTFHRQSCVYQSIAKENSCMLKHICNQWAMQSLISCPQHLVYM